MRILIVCAQAFFNRTVVEISENKLGSSGETDSNLCGKLKID